MSTISCRQGTMMVYTDTSSLLKKDTLSDNNATVWWGLFDAWWIWSATNYVQLCWPGISDYQAPPDPEDLQFWSGPNL